MKNILKTISLGLVAGIVLTGCGITHKTVVKPYNNKVSHVNIVSSQETSALGSIRERNIVKTNYKYAFGIAATSTKKAGFEYFSISEPKRLMEQYTKYKVTNVQEAYDACVDVQDGAFRVFLSMMDTTKVITDGFGAERYNNCDQLIPRTYSQATYMGSVYTAPVDMKIEMHNEDRQDNITFNADEVLKSDLLKGLNKDWFNPIVR